MFSSQSVVDSPFYSASTTKPRDRAPAGFHQLSSVPGDAAPKAFKRYCVSKDKRNGVRNVRFKSREIAPLSADRAFDPKRQAAASRPE